MKTKGKYTMEANIVSNGQMQNLFRIKSMMKGLNTIDNLEYQLNDMKWIENFNPNMWMDKTMVKSDLKIVEA